MKQDREAAISARAHQLWEESGHAHGQHDDHWRKAEREYDEAEAQAATVEMFTAEAAPAKPSRKKPAKAAASMVDTAAPAKKPRVSRKSSATTALN